MCIGGHEVEGPVGGCTPIVICGAIPGIRLGVDMGPTKADGEQEGIKEESGGRA